MRNMPPITIAKEILIVMVVGVVLAVSACQSDNTPAPNTQSRSSIYDPMKDAAPGDDLPAVPSVNQITPDQAMGNGNEGGVIYNPSAAASLGALGSGRR